MDTNLILGLYKTRVSNSLVTFTTHKWLLILVQIIMPRCTCASDVYSSVFVCVDCYTAAQGSWSAGIRVSIVMFSFVDLQNTWMLCSRILLTWNAIAAFSEEFVIHWVLLLYLVIRSALERLLLHGSCKSDKRAHAAINTIMVNHYPSFPVMLSDAKMLLCV